MIEIALCLAIVGFALVSILLVLPSGMNTQTETRQETIINQDASVLLEAIRNGARGMDDLTNNVYAITNYWTDYNPNGTVNKKGINGYTLTNSSIPLNWPQGFAFYPITNGLRIVGLLSTPEYTDGFLPITNLYNGGYSNHVVAYIRSLSGLATEKPPQNNQIMQEDAFSYRLFCVNAPMPADTNMLLQSHYMRELAGNVREVRLLFEWPQRPNGSVGDGRQSFRTSIGGAYFVMTNDMVVLNQKLYFYQADSFTNTP